MRVVHISDVHVGDTPPGRLDEAAAAIRALEPDVIALSGDVTQSGRSREYTEAAAFLEALEAPVVATPGNHDAPVYHPILRLFRPYGRFSALPAAGAWDAPHGNLTIRQVRTARAVQPRRDWSQGAYNLADLADAVDHAPESRWRVILAHHPPQTLAGMRVRSDARRGDRARAALNETHRLLVLTGHSHSFAVDPVNARGVAVIVAPSLASGRRRSGAHGFVQIDFEDDAARWILHADVGEGYEPALSGEVPAG